ncbi:MAG: arylesterase [Planctomycetes bacterium]|nr:arylesterase [Planctomycetota bacterium]
MSRPSSIVLFVALLAACAREPEPVPALPGERESTAAEREAAQESRETHASSSDLAIPSDAPLVIFLGDSLAAGLHLSAEDAFPAVLQRELARDGKPFRLVNAGVSGDTSAGGLRRVDWVLSQAPAVLVIELGANDGLRGQSVASVEQNLRGIVERAKTKGANVLLLGVRLPPSLGDDYVQAFEEIYPRVAKDERIAFVPFFMQGVGGVPEMLLEDGLHPNRAGHERIAAKIAPELRALLDARGAANPSQR